MKQYTSQTCFLNKINKLNQKGNQPNFVNKPSEVSLINKNNNKIEKRIPLEPKITKIGSSSNNKSDLQKKEEFSMNSRSSSKTTDDYQSKQNQINSAEDHIQDSEETKGTIPHNLYTKRNSLVLEKENQTSQKQIQDEQASWKQKYLELHKTLQESNRQQFIQDRKIQDLQIQLQNERNKSKFYEKNQENLQGLKRELEEEKEKRKLIEDRLVCAQSQIQTQNVNNNQKSQQVNSYQHQQQQQYISLRKMSLEGSNKSNIESRNRQSLSRIETQKDEDKTKDKVLQMNQFQILTQQNKNLLLKVSDQEKQIQYLLDQQFYKEQSLEVLSQENSVLGNQLREYSQILSNLGYFQSQKKQVNNLFQMNSLNQNSQDQNANLFMQMRNVSGIPPQKNENFESVSDQSFTININSQINLCEDISKKNSKAKTVFSQNQQLKDNHSQHKQLVYSKQNLEQIHFQELKKQLDHPYQNEIQFVQDNGENTNRLSKLCSC